MNKKHKKISHAQIRIALEQFFSQGGQIQVLPAQKVDAHLSQNYSLILAELESFDVKALIPNDLNFTLRNSVYVKPLLDS